MKEEVEDKQLQKRVKFIQWFIVVAFGVAGLLLFCIYGVILIRQTLVLTNADRVEGVVLTSRVKENVIAGDNLGARHQYFFVAQYQYQKDGQTYRSRNVVVGSSEYQATQPVCEDLVRQFPRDGSVVVWFAHDAPSNSWLIPEMSMDVYFKLHISVVFMSICLAVLSCVIVMDRWKVYWTICVAWISLPVLLAIHAVAILPKIPSFGYYQIWGTIIYLLAWIVILVLGMKKRRNTKSIKS